VLLFRLLDCETEAAAVRLYAALGALRLAYQGISSGNQGTSRLGASTAAAAETIGTYMTQIAHHVIY
jgi:hypothetical protein